MIKYNLKISLRYLLKNKLQSLLIIGGFSIGFAVFIMIMLFFYTEKSVNNGFANHKNIYRLYDRKKNSFNLNYDLISTIDSNYSGIAGICPMDFFNGFEFIAKDESSKKSITVSNIVCTENSFYRIFSANIIESTSGNLFDRKEAFSITKSLAHKLYGSQSAIGHTLSFGNDFINFSGTITSVIEDLPENSSFKADILLNGENKDYRFSTTCEDNKCWNVSSIFVQLDKAYDAAEITNQINKSFHVNPNETGQIGLLELDNIYLSSLTLKDSHSKGNTILLKIFLIIALLVLTLSAINYFNYSVSQQYAKFRTIGISKTTGANRKQLASYILTEAIVGIIIVAVLSIIIVIMFLPFSSTLFGKEILSVKELLPRILPVVLFTMILLILFNSIVALYFQSQYKITDFFAGLKNRKGNQVGKKVLLTFQMTVSIALFASLLGLSKQIGFMKNANLGFDKDLLLRIDLPKKNTVNMGAFQQEIEKLPFVAQSAYSVGSPGKITLRMGSNKEGKDFLVNCIIIGDNYLNTMGIELIKGREFRKSDIDNVCLLNEEAVKQFEFTDIEGEIFYNGKEEGYEIVGITKNFHISSFYNSIEPVALIYSPETATSSLSVRLSGTNLNMYTDQFRKVWEKFFPYDIMNLRFYDKEFEAMYKKEDKLLGSITFFSVIAIILTCMGILSQIIITSIKRTKEIGIRKVNGARVVEIITMLNKDFIVWIIIAFVIACPVALYALHKWLENFAYKTTLSWWIFAGAGAVAVAVAIITVSWHSWRAATRNPVEALRYE